MGVIRESTRETKLWTRVNKNGPVSTHRPDLGPCWIWTGALTDKGYARIRHNKKLIRVHILLYERFIGAVPGGLELDHLCRVKNCVRPEHMEAVTHQVNVARAYAVKTHCPAGHPLSGENLLPREDGYRECLECHRRRGRESQRRRRARTGGERGPKTPKVSPEFCKNGHPLSGENLYVSPKGKRNCCACQRQRNRDATARKKAQAELLAANNLVEM